MTFTKVRRGTKLDLMNTIKVNTPDPIGAYKYNKEQKERTKRAERDARIVRLLSK